MPPVTVAEWVVDVDVGATRELYASVESGSEDCPCSHCQDWAERREDIYEPAALEILGNLGIDPRREAEVVDWDQMLGTHTCEAWFHFVGRIDAGPRAETWRSWEGSSTRIPDPRPISPATGVILLTWADLMKPAFEAASGRGTPVATIQIRTTRHDWEPPE